MKRSLFMAAAATLATTSVMAQSNVSIYGRVNVSVERQKTEVAGDSQSIWAMQNASSRIGFKGTEDLGGGLKASFLLEHGFNVDTGAASGTFWGRESWVALEGGFGRVRLGNMGPTAAYFATADYISMHNHDTGTSADAFYLYQGSAKNTVAWNQTFGPISAEVQYGLKSIGATESKAAGAQDTIVLVGNYDQGPLHVGVSYLDGMDVYGAALGMVGGTNAKQFGVRGLYEMGAITVGAYFINDKIDDDAGNTAKRNAFRVSAMYTMGASEFHANVGKAGKLKANGTTIDGTDATQYTLGYNYNLSKRTKVYAFYTALSGDGREFYAATNVGIDGFKNSLAAGIRHNF
jgi:predicted porin